MAYSTFMTNFTQRVLAYAQRGSATFTIGSNAVDEVLSAINDARKLGQDSYGFEQLKVKGFIKVNSGSGAPWKTPTGGYGPYTLPDGITALSMRGYDSLWNYTTGSDGSYQPTNQIVIDNERWFKNLLPKNLGFPYTSVTPNDPPYYFNTIPSQRTFAYIIGDTMYVNTTVAATWFMFFGTKQLADLTGQETTDFFIDNYSYWLIPATLQFLNLMIKDDQRVPIAQSVVNAAFERMTFADAKRGYQGDDWTSLD